MDSGKGQSVIASTDRFSNISAWDKSLLIMVYNTIKGRLNTVSDNTTNEFVESIKESQGAPIGQVAFVFRTFR